MMPKEQVLTESGSNPIESPLDPRRRFLEKLEEARIAHHLSDYDCQCLAEITQMPEENWDREFARELRLKLKWRDMPNPGPPSKETLRRLKKIQVTDRSGASVGA